MTSHVHLHTIRECYRSRKRMPTRHALIDGQGPLSQARRNGRTGGPGYTFVPEPSADTTELTEFCLDIR